MSESSLRYRFRTALGEVELPAQVSHQTRLALRQLADTPPTRLRWVPGAVAAILAVAIIAGLLAAGSLLRNHDKSANNGPVVVACADLVSAGAASRGGLTMQVFLFINASDSECTLTAPTISLIEASGLALDIPQDLAPGVKEAVLRVGAHQAAAVPYSINSLQCSQSLRFEQVKAIFSGTVEVRIALAGELCPGSRIVIAAPIPAKTCADGTFAWALPNSRGLAPSC
jgi:hypothetical protein